jgi:hypothetical protein
MKDKELTEILERNIDFIKQADTKAAYVSAVLFIVIGLLIEKSALFTDKRRSTVFLVLLLLFAVYIAFEVFRSIFPVIKNNLSKNSNIFFGSIAAKSYKRFREQIISTSTKEYREELLVQVHVTSVIADAKMSKVKKSIVLLFWFLVITGALTFIAKYY